MRILTIGAKPAINHALALRDDVEVFALTRERDKRSLLYPTIDYSHGNKVSLPSIRQVREAIANHAPDVVHAFYPRPLAHAVLAAISLGIRLPIVSYRGVTSVPIAWSPDQWITYLSPWVAAHACESEAVADSLVAAGVPRNQCHVVHNCLNRPPAPMPRAAARCELGIPSDAFVVMMVANMRRVKGADLLMKAAIACSDLSNAHFVLVGQVIDKEVEQLAADVRLTDRITLTGYRSDASQLLRAGDLFVMPSRAEALCVAVIEAMAAGVCPVVSDAGGMKEAVRHEQDGLVFPSNNVDALEQAIRRLHFDRDCLLKMGRSALKRAGSRFSSDAVAERIVGVYDGLRTAA